MPPHATEWGHGVRDAALGAGGSERARDGRKFRRKPTHRLQKQPTPRLAPVVVERHLVLARVLVVPDHLAGAPARPGLDRRGVELLRQ